MITKKWEKVKFKSKLFIFQVAFVYSNYIYALSSKEFALSRLQQKWELQWGSLSVNIYYSR